MIKKSNDLSAVYTSNSAKKTIQLAARIAKKFRAGDILCLQGTLGSGKTHFVQGLARGWGLRSVVNSPTYIYVHEYILPKPIKIRFYHVDLYRVATMEKLREIGLEETLFSEDNIIVVEWPELLLQHYPHLKKQRRIISISLKKTADTNRTITIAQL